MSDAETIAELRALLAERDAEIRGLRGMLAGDIETARRIWADAPPFKPPFINPALFLRKPSEP